MIKLYMNFIKNIYNTYGQGVTPHIAIAVAGDFWELMLSDSPVKYNVGREYSLGWSNFQ